MLNIADFNTDIFFKKSNLIIDTDTFATVINIAKELLKTNSNCLMVARTGYGVSTAFNYIRKKFKVKVVILEINGLTDVPPKN